MSDIFGNSGSNSGKQNQTVTIVIVICCCLVCVVGGFFAYQQGWIDTFTKKVGRLFGNKDTESSSDSPGSSDSAAAESPAGSGSADEQSPSGSSAEESPKADEGGDSGGGGGGGTKKGPDNQKGKCKDKSRKAIYCCGEIAEKKGKMWMSDGKTWVWVRKDGNKYVTAQKGGGTKVNPKCTDKFEPYTLRHAPPLTFTVPDNTSSTLNHIMGTSPPK